ncbi:MAG: TIGR03546 family protein [Spirochaetes bacterium]|nr:TIGR03546 family protein [Spirochaetota bacterium]
MVPNWIIKSVAAINANNRPHEVAAAITIGITLGLIPAGNIIWFVLLSLTFFLKINFGMQMIVIAIIKPIAHFFDPVFDFVGYRILTTNALEGIFTQWYNMPIVPFTSFNNTAVVGSIIVMILLFIPLWFGVSKLIKLYREKIRDKIMSSAIVKKLVALPILSKIINFVSRINNIKNSIH